MFLTSKTGQPMRASVSVLLGIFCSVYALTAAEAPEFARDVRPILERHCAGCHSGASAQASLDVRSRASLIKGGVSGAAIGGLLITAASHEYFDHRA